jgi:hypothetical protein
MLKFKKMLWSIFRKVIQTIGPSDYWAFGLLGIRTIGLSILNIKVNKRWIPLVRNWISNFTVVQYIKKHSLATIADFWTEVVSYKCT